AIASSSAVRSTPIQAPRPGAFARTSGATTPSGPNASRISPARGTRSPVRTHLRTGTWPAASPSSSVVRRGSLGGFRMRVLPGLILEPMRTRGHDDLVALVLAQAIFGKHAALVLLARRSALGPA